MRPLVALSVLCLLALVGCATREVAAPPPPETVVGSSGPGNVAVATTATATVEEVDQKTRQVTLRNSEGERFTITAGDEVRNLAQVKRGDVVTMTYYESLALALRPAEGEKPSVKVAEGGERAPAGAKPGGVVVRETTLTAKVTKVDRTKKTVTLEGPEGNAVTLKVQDPRQLEKVSVGKLVEARYREAIAIAVTKPE